jgi:hypothetical protein
MWDAEKGPNFYAFGAPKCKATSVNEGCTQI